MPTLQRASLSDAISAATSRGCALCFIDNRVFIVPESQINLRGLDALGIDSALEGDGGALVSFARLNGIRS